MRAPGTEILESKLAASSMKMQSRLYWDTIRWHTNTAYTVRTAQNTIYMYMYMSR